MLWQVTTSYFCCGIETDGYKGRVTKAAPIMKWAVGKPLITIVEWVEKKKGRIELVADDITGLRKDLE